MLKHSQVLERELDHLAHHDPLTGLPNRVRFTERVAELTRLRQETGEDFAVLFIDLDDFKTVNDSLGHSAGDELLTVVAAMRFVHSPRRHGRPARWRRVRGRRRVGR